MSETQEPYVTELRQIADEQRADGAEAQRQDAEARWPPVSVTIQGPAREPCERLAQLLIHILGQPCPAIEEIPGQIRLIGFVDGPIEDFLNQLAEKDAKIEKLGAVIHDLEDLRVTFEARFHEAATIADALESRLAEVEGRKLALAVAHGDVPPENFERRRQVAIEGIRAFVATIRTSNRQRNMARRQDTDNS